MNGSPMNLLADLPDRHRLGFVWAKNRMAGNCFSSPSDFSMDEQLELLYLDCRWSFGALLNFEADTITFRKALKTLSLDGTMMDEDIFPALNRNKSVTLLIVEPLYCTLRHNSSNPFILLVWTLLNARNINVKSRWTQEIKQELLVLKKQRNRFHQLLRVPHNPITRTLNHRIHYPTFTLACPPEISPDPDNFLFG
jgi:hypothetical protein